MLPVTTRPEPVMVKLPEITASPVYGNVAPPPPPPPAIDMETIPDEGVLTDTPEPLTYRVVTLEYEAPVFPLYTEIGDPPPFRAYDAVKAYEPLKEYELDKT